MANKDSITIKGREVPVEIGKRDIIDLRFYPENPRIHSIVCQAGAIPTQDEIFEKLGKMEHVKQLMQSIKSNKGLKEPVVVLGDMVIEGNSRLAAYKLLAGKDPITWGAIKCKTILEQDVNGEIEAAILADHIAGKKDWAPYEQAGYLYRRVNVHGVSIEVILEEVPISKAAIINMINVYEFMILHKERDIDKWSYYDEYLKNRKIKSARLECEKLDGIIVSKIKSGEICKAIDMREKLPFIVTSKKILAKFISEEKDFQKCFESVESSGRNDGSYIKLHKFRNWLTEEQVNIADLVEPSKNKCKFEIDKIFKLIEKIAKKLGS